MRCQSEWTDLRDTYVANVSNRYRNNAGNRNRHNNLSSNGNSNNGQTRGGRPCVTPYYFRAYKLKTKCTSCGNLGHWATEYMSKGTIKENRPSIFSNGTSKNTVHFIRGKQFKWSKNFKWYCKPQQRTVICPNNGL